MFFDNTDLDIKILSVLKLTRESMHGFASSRGFHALSFRVSGGADFVFSDKRLYTKGGDLIYIPAFADYRIDSGSEELYVIHFMLNDAPSLPPEVFSPADAKYYERKFRDIYAAWSKKEPGYAYECKADLLKILSHTIKQSLELNSPGSGRVPEEIVKYIHENYTDKSMTVASLAAMANMSETYFRKLFIQRFSVSPHKYISSLRLSHAIELLSSGYYTVSEAALKSGYDSQNYFSYAVKKATGLSPQGYKAKALQKD